MPATLADARLAALTAGALRIVDARGTIWRGQGALTDARAGWQIPLTWTLDAAAIFTGEIVVTLAPMGNASDPMGTIVATTRRIALRDVRATLPAPALAALLPIRSAPALGGDISIDAPAFRWSDGTSEGALNLRWMRARVATAAGSLDLGTVDVAVTPQGPRLAGRVTNAGGDVRVDGTLGLTADGNDGELTIAPLPGTPPALLRALATLATPDVNGAVRLTWRNRHR